MFKSEDFFKGCEHDWETVEEKTGYEIYRSIGIERYCGFTIFRNRVCLRCHEKDFKIDEFISKIKREKKLKNKDKN